MAEAGPYLVPGEDLSVKRQLYLLRVFGGGKLLLVIIHEAVALLDDRIQACGLIRKPHILSYIAPACSFLFWFSAIFL